MEDQTTNQTNPEQGPTTPTGDAWREVGQQFANLGESLGNAFKTAWHDEDNHAFLKELQGDLQSMVSRLDQFIQETSQSEKGQQIRDEAEKMAQSLHDAGSQTYQDYKPQVVNALKQFGQDIEKLVERMENSGKSGGGE